MAYPVLLCHFLFEVRLCCLLLLPAQLLPLPAPRLVVLARADARITEKIHEARPLTRYGLFRYRERYMRVLKFGGSSLADA